MTMHSVHLVRTLSMVAAATAASAVLVAGPSSALAPRQGLDSACDEVVADPDGRLNDPSAVFDAASALGSNMHVRVEGRLDSARSVDPARDRFEQLLVQCPSWQSAEGRAEDLFVVVVLPNERSTGMYYGSNYAVLDNTWLDIQQQSMNPSFKNGDWDGGLINGLTAVFAQIDAGGPQPTPPSDGAEAGVPDPTFVGVGGPTAEAVGSDDDGGVPTLFVLGALGIGVIGLIGATSRNASSSIGAARSGRSSRLLGAADRSASSDRQSETGFFESFGRRSGSSSSGSSSFGSSSFGSDSFGGSGSSDSGSSGSDSGGGSSSW